MEEDDYNGSLAGTSSYAMYSSAIWLSSPNLQLRFEPRDEPVLAMLTIVDGDLPDGSACLTFGVVAAGTVPAQLVAIVGLLWRPYVDFSVCPDPTKYGLEVRA